MEITVNGNNLFLLKNNYVFQNKKIRRKVALLNICADLLMA